MEQEQEPDRGQKTRSYKRHIRSLRRAEGALRSIPLGRALENGTGRLQEAKDKHESAAAIIKRDLELE